MSWQKPSAKKCPVCGSYMVEKGNKLVCSQESGTVQIKGETVYKVTDVIDVTIAEVRMETRSIIARPVA